ncbi:SIMPL domain-containing protein [Gilvimarinus sp. SDUM040013]|uniref:SIMPL domain-containing protein n=1 Tax=Gilvimarinus gilvus TaxID=3058038 RepID=A0ABU4RWN5_9GAMM|nr:SIMPL domain-containing protein [Gilvimarinus sp. SDUM040013]MDO3388467.1 SIMPL domain-containing protein [Gilvimarinus sp. SDUM040013]MDX6848661.1 SIMPL domain-containing protein [Gilvimarinus sp. SDUM040013]
MKSVYSAIALLLTVLTAHSYAQSGPDFPHIVVSGLANIEVPPDIVTLNFQIMEYASEAEVAVDTVTQRAAQVVRLAAEAGLKREHIESWAIDKRPRRSHEPGSNNMAIVGYEVTQRFVLNIEGLEAYETIVNALLRMPNTTGLNAEFDVSNRDDVISNLTAKAGQDARRKAKALAAGLEVELGQVFSITDQQAGYNPRPQFGMDEAQFSRMSVGAKQPSFELFAPQGITLDKQIHVIFSIQQ